MRLFLWYVLNYTAWGRRVYAVGDDPDAAELSGVPVKRMLVTVYTISGLICAFAGWVLIGRIGSVSPTSGEFANIESITAVVIGGISLFGGRGSILGMIFGALIVGVFSLGLRLDWHRSAMDLSLDRRAHHRRRGGRPMDQKGFGLITMAKKATADRVPLLTARGLVKRYGRVTALDNADFDLYPGEILAVIGDNGAGKSTLIKAICGAVTARRGRDQARWQDAALQVADGSPQCRHRDGLPEPGPVAGAVDRRQHVPGPRNPQTRHPRQVVPHARPAAPWKSAPATS